MEQFEEKLTALEEFCSVRVLQHEEKRVDVTETVKSLVLSFDVMEGAWDTFKRFAKVWDLLELDTPKTLPKFLDSYLELLAEEWEPSCSVREKAHLDTLTDEDWLDWVCDVYLFACGNMYLRSEQEQEELFKDTGTKVNTWGAWILSTLAHCSGDQDSQSSYFYTEKEKCDISEERAFEIEREARKVVELSYNNTEDNREEVLDIAMKRIGETKKGVFLPEYSRQRAFQSIACRLRPLRECAEGNTEEARRGVWEEYLGALGRLWDDVLHDLNE